MADIDLALVVETVARTSVFGRSCGLVLNGTRPLPFCNSAFDAVLITDFVNHGLLLEVGRIIRGGGVLIYESYRNRGENWRELLPIGVTGAALQHDFDIIHMSTQAVGPTESEAETVKLLARRRTS